jgi:dinuclear metal center YbgI/SA1388 family protein
MPSIDAIATFLDETLSIATIPDYANALNGLQLSNLGDITKVASAVDFSTETATGAVDAGARLLIVHHGMFWGGLQPITSHRHARLWTLMTHDVAVYSAHLPLDVHPTLGNNALLAKRFGLTPTGGFAKYQSIDIGVSGESITPTRALAEHAATLSKEYGGSLVATPFDPDRITRRWAICSGSGADSSTLREAAMRRIDTLIVGEGPHHTAIEARELGIVVLYAGHYATETLGVQALSGLVATRFDIESTFIHAPSGL